MLITNVTGNFFLKENDTATEMHLAVQEVDGTPVDLSTASKVEVVIGTLEGRYLTKVPTILDAPGEFTFGLDEGDMLPTGDNLLEVHIFDGTNSKRVAPSKGHYKLKVQRTIGALGLTVTTYTLDYFLSEVNRILFGLPQLLERGEALADRMDELVVENEQLLDDMNLALGETRTATVDAIGATVASELATQAAQQATTSAETATQNAVQAKTDADAATQASIAQTQAAQTATQNANTAAQYANEYGQEAEFQAFQAENAIVDAQDATRAANTATDNANAASSRANTSAGRADTATTSANSAANAANTAATEANTARDSANLAASLADGIATELRGYDNAIATFSLETRYLKHQPVRFDGSTYKAKVETQGNPLPVAPARSNEWFDLVAEKGEKGDMGTGINILGKVGSVAELPASGVPGDAYLIGANIHIWDGDGWLDGGPIQGPQGEIGPQGEVGVGLQYSWDGSQLGVKRADESTYTYRDLKGAKGEKGDNAKIITLDFVIPATDATQVDGNLINVHDYIYDAAADSIQFYLNSRILYPGEDFEMEGSTFRLLNWTGYDDPANVTFYIKVTRSVFNIDPEVSHATVVGALGYTPVDSATLTEHLLDRTLKHHVHHVAEVPTDLQNMGIMFKVDGSSSDVPGVTTNTDLMNRVVQAEQKFDTEINDVATQLAQTTAQFINVDTLLSKGYSLDAIVELCKQKTAAFYLPYGKKLKLSKTLNLFGLHVRIEGSIEIDFNGIGIIVGRSSTTPAPTNIFINFVSHTNYLNGDISVRLQGVKNGSVHIGYAQKLQLYADGDDSTISSIAYTTINLGTVNTVEVTSKFDATGMGWINDNLFIGGRVSHILIDGNYPHQNNVFLKTCVEGASSSITLNVGVANIFEYLRNEGYPTYTLSSKASNNFFYINHPTPAGWNLFNHVNWKDSGEGNYIMLESLKHVIPSTVFSMNPETYKNPFDSQYQPKNTTFVKLSSDGKYIENTYASGNIPVFDSTFRIDKLNRFGAMYKDYSGNNNKLSYRVRFYDANMQVLTGSANNVLSHLGMTYNADSGIYFIDNVGNMLFFVPEKATQIKYARLEILLTPTAKCTDLGVQFYTKKEDIYLADKVRQAYIQKPVIRGYGSPQNVVTANVGTIYLDLNGSSGSVLYIKETGTSNTGWVAK